MSGDWRHDLWSQLGAAIEALEQAISAWPAEEWGETVGEREPWYLAYHTLFFLDYDLSESPEGFAPPAPFDLRELDPAGLLPERPYSQEELLGYAAHCRDKARRRLAAVDEETARKPCGFPRRDMSVREHLLYALRHLPHHTGQLAWLLRERAGQGSPWVARARERLEIGDWRLEIKEEGE